MNNNNSYVIVDQKLEHLWKHNDTITECLSKVPQNSIRIIGHDLNASVGNRTVDDEGTTNDVLGPFGFNNRNEKGLMAIDFLQHNNFRVMTTFF